MKDMSISNKLFEKLLHHYWKAYEAGAPKAVSRFPKGYAISYGDLIDIAAVPIDPRNAGGYLWDIAYYCDQNGLPPLHALVVNKESGIPGDGFLTAPPHSQEHPGDWSDWEVDIMKCIADVEKKLPRVAPLLR